MCECLKWSVIAAPAAHQRLTDPKLLQRVTRFSLRIICSPKLLSASPASAFSPSIITWNIANRDGEAF